MPISPNIGYVRLEMKRLVPQYQLIRDCIDGETAVKRAGVKYLPMPNAADASPENKARYNSYKERAVFYNVTKRTLFGLVGQIYTRPPEVKLPTQLELMEADADGGNVSLEQLSKRAVIDVLAFGRAGILADYPVTEAATTKAEQESGDVRPTLTVYSPWNIINWRKTLRGARSILSLVVLREDAVIADDGFELKKGDNWRVLQLVDNKYCVTIWSKNTPTSGVDASTSSVRTGESFGRFVIVEGPYFPTDANGNYFNEIPFSFIGAENNDDLTDLPPLYDLASINVAHYRNSADYEESCFLVGQPTPYFSGLTEEWVKDVLKGQVQLGSRAAIPLPAGGDAGLLQAEPNGLAFEAMTHKEKQMVALGAKLVEAKEVQRTATETRIDNASETSTLASSANNVSEAVERALKWCALFAGADDNVTFKLHTDFSFIKMSDAEQKQMVANWQSGAIAFEEMRDNFKRSGIATLDTEDAKAKIDAELELIPAMNPKNPANQNNNPNPTDPKGGKPNAA